MRFRSHINKVEYAEVVYRLPNWQHTSSTWMLAWQVEEGWKSMWSEGGVFRLSEGLARPALNVHAHLRCSTLGEAMCH